MNQQDKIAAIRGAIAQDLREGRRNGLRGYGGKVGYYEVGPYSCWREDGLFDAVSEWVHDHAIRSGVVRRYAQMALKHSSIAEARDAVADRIRSRVVRIFDRMAK